MPHEDAMHEISPTALATLQADLAHVKATLDRLVGQVEPVLLARSGDLATVAALTRDIDSAHEKACDHSRRITKLERIVAMGGGRQAISALMNSTSA